MKLSSSCVIKYFPTSQRSFLHRSGLGALPAAVLSLTISIACAGVSCVYFGSTFPALLASFAGDGAYCTVLHLILLTMNSGSRALNLKLPHMIWSLKATI